MIWRKALFASGGDAPEGMGAFSSPSSASRKSVKRKAQPKEDSAVSSYFAEVGRFRMLSSEEEKAYGKAIRIGSKPEASEEERKVAEAAKEALVNSNLRLVVSIAKTYGRGSIPLLDLIQEGNTGLLKAAERFDPDVGARFSTYATPWIRQAIAKAFLEQGGAVQLPLSIARQIAEIKRVSQKLSQKLEREPTEEEIAAEMMDLDAQSVAEMLSYSISVKSMNDPLREDSEEEFVDTISSVEDELGSSIAREERLTLLEKGLSYLREEEKTVIVNLYGIGCEKKNLKGVAMMLGKSPERVRQIREQALWRMRKRFGKEK